MGSIVRNSLYSSISFGLRFLSNAFLFIVIARFLGAEEFGKFALASSLSGIFLIVLDYGFNLYAVREVAVSPPRALEFAAPILSTKLLLAAFSTLMLLAVLWGMGYSRDICVVTGILWAGYIFYSCALFFNSIFRALNLFQYEMYPTILLNVVQIALVALLLWLGQGIVAIALAFFASRVLYFAYSSYLFRVKVGRPVLSFNIGQSRRLMLETMPFGIHAIVGVLYFQLDTILLSYFKGNSDIGYYQSAMRIVTASMVISEVLVCSYLPTIAATFRSDPERFCAASTALNKYLIVVGSTLAAALLVYADSAMALFYGPGYLQAVVILQLLCVVIFMRFLGGGYGVLITVSGNQRMRAIGVSSSLAVNLLLNLFLIPRFGIVGAAAACILTHVFLNAMYLIFTFRALDDLFLDRRLLPMLGWLLIASCAAYLAKPFSFAGSLLLFVPLSALSLFSSLDDREKSAFKGAVAGAVPAFFGSGGQR